MPTTDQYQGMLAETVAVPTVTGDAIYAYYARPTGPGPFPGLILFHHRPGWDEWYHEITRRFAHHGYATICPDLFFRFGHGDPDDVAAKARAEGGVPDDMVVEDARACLDFLRGQPTSTGDVGVMGTCSGGRHAYLVACNLEVEACIDCWGGRVVHGPDDTNDITPIAPIDMTADLSAPLLGLFGEDDRNPPPEQVAQHEEVLRQHGKDYEFHMYPGAGHGFFYYDKPSNYRAEQSNDGWAKIWDFLSRTIG